MYSQIIDNLRSAYDQKVEERDGKSIAHWKERERDHFLAALRNEGKRTLLEIGAGTGKYGRFFQDQGLDVVVTDLSPAMVKACRNKGLDARVMDFLNLDFPANTFDAVFALNTLLHVPKNDFAGVLRAVKRVLKQDGLFYLGQYGGQDFEGVHPDDHYRPQRFFSHFADESMKKAVSQEFDIIYFEAVVPADRKEPNVTYNFQSIILRPASGVGEAKHATIKLQ